MPINDGWMDRGEDPNAVAQQYEVQIERLETELAALREQLAALRAADRQRTLLADGLQSELAALRQDHDLAVWDINRMAANMDAAQAELAALRWIRVTARDDSLPPIDMTQVEMLLVTKVDGEFLAMTSGEQLKRLAASGNPKIKDYYWRPFTHPAEAGEHP